MAEDFVSRTRPRTWDPRTRTRTQLFVLEAPRTSPRGHITAIKSQQLSVQVMQMRRFILK